jgi:glycosyltransferase involved in cell wall biosynthesis
MAQRDVAIYTASSTSAGLYDRTRRRAGGAERQMTLLAQALSADGQRVAHIIHAPRDAVVLENPRLTLVHRAPYAGDRRAVGSSLEAIRIWQALTAADARVVIVRTGGPAVGLAALFCKSHGRQLIFSSANNSDFDLETAAERPHRQMLYRLGVRLADAVVVQSEDQLGLARTAFPRLRRIERIPSFAEIPPANGGPVTKPDAFLWAGRVVDYKRPMRYVDLARALPQARFVMIALPQGSSARRLAELRAAAQDASNLRLLEPVPHSDLMDLISHSVAVVNTATFEGMPNIFLEAWARGVPALTLEFDPDRIVERRRLGVAAGGSWDQFVAGASELWERRHDRGEFSRHARMYLQEVHSPEVVGASWSALVSQLR